MGLCESFKESVSWPKHPGLSLECISWLSKMGHLGHFFGCSRCVFQTEENHLKDLKTGINTGNEINKTQYETSRDNVLFLRRLPNMMNSGVD